MDTQRYRTLSARMRALVAVAVLLDGREAATYLEHDSTDGGALGKAAQDLATLPTELRMPYVGTMLRGSLRDMASRTRYQ